MRILLAFFSLAAVLFLSACAGLPKEGASGGGAGSAATSAKLPTLPALSAEHPFHRQGRFAVHAEQMGQNPEAVQGGFHWYDDGQQLLLELRNPLGNTMAQLQVDERGAWLQDTQAGMRFGHSADALAREVLKQPIPVEGLRYWLRGGVSPQATNLRFETGAQLEQAHDQGWRVVLNQYDAQGPKRLLLVFNQGGQRITVRIAVDADPDVQ